MGTGESYGSWDDCNSKDNRKEDSSKETTFHNCDSWLGWDDAKDDGYNNFYENASGHKAAGYNGKSESKWTSDESIENALRACFIGIQIGKFQIHGEGDSGQQGGKKAVVVEEWGGGEEKANIGNAYGAKPLKLDGSGEEYPGVRY
ncbi:probable ADP-ribosylation factor GTPase-activating AGD6 [Olea europaea subsp. europaea]|uniref:Probable ADP-ribosylation factor GTPase-activating AGD6 n=1 Tax=Olea europaea subsp. europaea TaxID=158383 RepID=A0A8S0PQ11_OLEEU|nr:probable ADP-ribosylation factor GTPase-activating AGD6 [Olea europaea subsp. europaea]